MFSFADALSICCMDNPLLKVSPEIKDALAGAQPVVALESTIIAHGMPYPDNVTTAGEVAKRVREHGALPATIGIIDGFLQVGMSDDQIERLGRQGEAAHKVSRRDIPFALNRNDILGATTVAATMIIAQLAGIRIFATGGIGGVHRGAAESFDISADLNELGRTNVAVVCAGAKSILDIGLTSEYLETLGVPVIGYRTDRWPAFHTRTSEYPVDYRLDSTAEIAAMLHTKWTLPLDGGVVICTPVPEAFAMDEDVIEQAITDALEKMRAKGISGKQSTPFLLAEIAELTSGDSLKTNIQLVLNNAKLAAQIAVAYSG